MPRKRTKKKIEDVYEEFYFDIESWAFDHHQWVQIEKTRHGSLAELHDFRGIELRGTLVSRTKRPVKRGELFIRPDAAVAPDREDTPLGTPKDYRLFVALMRHCKLVLTDSGGVQEEAPSLGKPVLVMRDTTERPEGVDGGTVRLVGASARNIVESVTQLLTDEAAYRSMAEAVNPYGDGKAAGRIVARIQERFAGASRSGSA